MNPVLFPTAALPAVVADIRLSTIPGLHRDRTISSLPLGHCSRGYRSTTLRARDVRPRPPRRASARMSSLSSGRVVSASPQVGEAASLALVEGFACTIRPFDGSHMSNCGGAGIFLRAVTTTVGGSAFHVQRTRYTARARDTVCVTKLGACFEQTPTQHPQCVRQCVLWDQPTAILHAGFSTRCGA